MIRIDKTDILKESMEKRLKQSFSKVKEEMEDHKEAINENTNEINFLHSYVAELEKMINKLGERLEQAELTISRITNNAPNTEEYRRINLSPKEKEIFLVLYSRAGETLDYRDLSRITGFSEEAVRKCIFSMVQKGIPIIKKYYDNRVFLVLDSDFRNRQARENFLKIKE